MATNIEAKPTATVVPFASTPTERPEASPKALEKLWGKEIGRHGYAAIPAILVRAQHRLGVNPTQFCILVQLLEYWRTKDRAPFPTKQQLADRIGVGQSTIQQNIRTLEKAGLLKREQHKTTSGDWGANTYLLDGLVAKLVSLEPEFQEERTKRLAMRRRVETPKGLRKGEI